MLCLMFSSVRCSFNSRSREGATSGIRLCFPGVYVSIHAPVRERLPTTRSGSGVLSFNSRSREGATPNMPLTVSPRLFQFTLP